MQAGSSASSAAPLAFSARAAAVACSFLAHASSSSLYGPDIPTPEESHRPLAATTSSSSLPAVASDTPPHARAPVAATLLSTIRARIASSPLAANAASLSAPRLTALASALEPAAPTATASPPAASPASSGASSSVTAPPAVDAAAAAAASALAAPPGGIITQATSIRDLDMRDIDEATFLICSGILFIGVRVIAYPSTLIKTRIQTDMEAARAGRTPRSLPILRSILQTEGIRGLFRGFAPSLIHTTLRQLYFWMYEHIRSMLKTANNVVAAIPPAYAEPIRDSIAGFGASFAYQAVCNPFDIVVQRLMVQNRAKVRQQQAAAASSSRAPAAAATSAAAAPVPGAGTGAGAGAGGITTAESAAGVASKAAKAATRAPAAAAAASTTVAAAATAAAAAAAAATATKAAGSSAAAPALTPAAAGAAVVAPSVAATAVPSTPAAAAPAAPAAAAPAAAAPAAAAPAAAHTRAAAHQVAAAVASATQAAVAPMPPLTEFVAGETKAAPVPAHAHAHAHAHTHAHAPGTAAAAPPAAVASTASGGAAAAASSTPAVRASAPTAPAAASAATVHAPAPAIPATSAPAAHPAAPASSGAAVTHPLPHPPQTAVVSQSLGARLKRLFFGPQAAATAATPAPTPAVPAPVAAPAAAAPAAAAAHAPPPPVSVSPPRRFRRGTVFSSQPLSPWRFPSLALARDIYRADGASAFYRGVVPSALLFSASSALWWGSFSALMTALDPLTEALPWMRTSPESLRFLSEGNALLPPQLSPRCVDLLAAHPWWAQHVAAALAGVASIVLTNPVDVCRTRLMVLARRGDGLTMRVLFKRLLAEEGPRALMAGALPRTLSYLPVSVAIMTVYQVSKVVALEVRLRQGAGAAEAEAEADVKAAQAAKRLVVAEHTT